MNIFGLGRFRGGGCALLMVVEGADLPSTEEVLASLASSSCFLLPFSLASGLDVGTDARTDSSRGMEKGRAVFEGLVRASFNSLGVDKSSGIDVGGGLICLVFCRAGGASAVNGACERVGVERPEGAVKYVISTSVKNLRDFESATMARQVSLLRSRVAAFPRMKREDFARVIATFIRRISINVGKRELYNDCQLRTLDVSDTEDSWTSSDTREYDDILLLSLKTIDSPEINLV